MGMSGGFETPTVYRAAHSMKLTGRIRGMKHTLLFLVVLLLAPLAALHAAEVMKPNIIFILCDDLAQGDVGCYGQKLIQTPNLDRMATEGTRYTQAYCGTTVCAPMTCPP
jgi:hypothetical protein